MRVIGITGGVGAGKSEVIGYIEKQYRAPVLLADDIGHDLMHSQGACYRAVIDLFGKEILTEDGEPDRKRIADLVFRDPQLLEQLNAVIHPAVRKEILHRIEDRRKEKDAFFFLESAILIEEKYDEICDELWYVYAGESVREARLKESRHYSEQKIRDVMCRQLPEAVFRRKCDFVIDNSADFSETAHQIDERMKQYEVLQHCQRQQR